MKLSADTPMENYKSNFFVRQWINALLFSPALTLAIIFPLEAIAQCTPSNTGTSGADQIICDEDNDAEEADVDALGGNDTLDLNGGTINSVFGGDGDDAIHVKGAIVKDSVFGGNGNDLIVLDNRSSDIGNYLSGGGIYGGAGDDNIQILDGLTFHVWGGEGNDQITLDGGFIFNYLDAGGGDDYIHWDEGISNEIRGGSGSDTLVIDSYSFEGDAILNGGDDLSAEDGDIDTLIFKLDYRVDGNKLTNWERVVVWGSSKIILTGSLNVGGGQDAENNPLGLHIKWGGQTFIDAKEYRITGNVANDGTIDLANKEFNTLIIQKDSDNNYGHYSGENGRLWLDVALNDSSAGSDQLIIRGDTSGSTYVTVYNRNGTGARTQDDGIKLISIEGDSTEHAFILNGDYTTKDEQPATIGGAYAYTLHHSDETGNEDGSWYLRSTISNSSRLPKGGMIRWQPAAVMYETLPQVLRSLNIPSTLRSRVGNRYWVGSSYRDVYNTDYTSSLETAIDRKGLWLRNGARYITTTPKESTTWASWDQTYYQFQFGIDFPLNLLILDTTPIVSLALHYGDSRNTVESFFGDGNIDAKTYGVSSYLTWYGYQGLYLDTQFKLSWFDFDFDAEDLRALRNSSEGYGYGFSVEGGWSFKLYDYYSITPHAQLIYTSEEAEDFEDTYAVKVGDINNNGFLLRLGTTFEKRKSQRKSSRNMYGSLPLERFGYYVTPGVTLNLNQETDLVVSGARLYQKPDFWYADLRMGASYEECGDHCSIYTELFFSSGLESIGDSFVGGLELGFRYKW
ncbi:autotransporter outer membrane beta-barrel domain-containing protein [Microbulbifer variabilis]|uniref:Autotransporter outer membrane beta-barrel domain-containing protein n=1 Tax=Microbulbifer variabilis TaxID=266805 RepID=A0ABY4VCH9_9GAMM|nr:autotransporter outer membrane beta-barrel domain-containing protein [Microbulbifer variabilis]USD20888.1 autotransporter outer membrane beta-barrel domain-containing protein [Microbulbifer variabilis]